METRIDVGSTVTRAFACLGAIIGEEGMACQPSGEGCGEQEETRWSSGSGPSPAFRGASLIFECILADPGWLL